MAAMRTILLICLACSCHLAAAELVRDDLLGFWRLDEQAVTDEQQDAAEDAKAVEMFGMSLTNRIGRVIFSSDAMVAGMWRLEDATETTATVVIQSKGGSEHRYHVTLDGDDLQVGTAPPEGGGWRRTAPGGLPLTRKP